VFALTERTTLLQQRGQLGGVLDREPPGDETASRSSGNDSGRVDLRDRSVGPLEALSTCAWRKNRGISPEPPASAVDPKERLPDELRDDQDVRRAGLIPPVEKDADVPEKRSGPPISPSQRPGAMGRGDLRP
jgi:hypothetical protein